MKHFLVSLLMVSAGLKKYIYTVYNIIYNISSVLIKFGSNPLKGIGRAFERTL